MLIDIDSSLNARKELARELGCPAELIGGDYAQMNMGTVPVLSLQARCPGTWQRRIYRLIL